MKLKYEYPQIKVKPVDLVEPATKVNYMKGSIGSGSSFIENFPQPQISPIAKDV